MEEKKTKILIIHDIFDNATGSGVIANNTYKLFNNDKFCTEFFTTKGRHNIPNYKYDKFFIEPYNTFPKYITNLSYI